ncbi:MAG: hypothetical protein COS19_06190 [Flavobacteriaceae bacterium CG02_land_8_20_14_3_00_34_13]|nr:MAG: hypothetical protein COS19_06190 [Flavobacteriaceae bacterium CG02_land_8_20_14_3_00_34_13]
MLSKETTLISIGDFVDVYQKLKQKGLAKFLSLFHLQASKRVSGKWDNYQAASDFWIIPELQAYWNQKISGNSAVEYEEYVAKKYLSEPKGLKILSIGCGEGVHERNFAKHLKNSEIIGVDLSEKRIQIATEKAKDEQLHIRYFAEDFRKLDLLKGSFDVVLFSSSLHHFTFLSRFLKEDIRPLLKNKGYVVVYEYCGPNRLQWKNRQLQQANVLLKQLPKSYKMFLDGSTIKKKVYRPGLLRMLLVDPSEAPDSSNLRNAIHQNFEIVEEKMLGWNILHILLKGIAHNFLDSTNQTKEWLHFLIQREEEFVLKTKETDAIFGVYQKMER